MRPLDWIVLITSLVSIVLYGLYRGRGSNTVDRYLLAGKTMPWYAMGLSIMATQASAVTFISTTGQSYVDGMRFVQAYFGLPIAMIVICATVVPLFHRARIYTAYEYLERRFDSKTRTLASVIFLCQRGLSAGLTLYAPAIVLSVILGWPERTTTMLMGTLVITYTVLGGIKAVTWSDVQQMGIIFLGLVVSLVTVIVLMPASVSFGDAMFLAGKAGRLNAVTTHFDWNDRFNIWSGLIGSTFLFLSYFGCDQSQVQRYLTGRSIAQSRLGLLFNAVAKIPMQFFILFIGAMVFVFYLFVQPPVLFQRAELGRIERVGEFQPLAEQYNRAFEDRRQAALALVEAHHARDSAAESTPHCGIPGGAEADRRRARRSREAGGEHRRRERFQRHQLHLPFVRHAPSAGGNCGADHRGDFRGGHVRQLRGDQLSGHRDRGGHLPAVRSPRGQRPPLPGGLALGHAVLGRLCGDIRRMGQAAGIADRGGQRGGIAFLRLSAGMFRAGAGLPAGGRNGHVHRNAGRRSRHLLGFPVHRHVVPLVQRDRLRGGGGDGAGHHLPRARRHRHHTRYAATSIAAAMVTLTR